MLGVAYKEALASALGEKTSVWHYASDFGTLWSDELCDDRSILIVWDRASLGGLDDRGDRLLERHLTPLDWALSWSKKRAREGKDLPSIAIVDVRVDNWGGGWAWTVRRQLLADMPWVALCAPVVRRDGRSPLHMELVDSVMLGDSRSLDSALRPVSELWKRRHLIRSEAAALQNLSGLWMASLNLSDEHHDINNIVGARILLEQAKDNGGYGIVASSVVTVFLQKVAWLRGKNIESAQWKPRKNKKNDLSDSGLYLTIYDDMHHAGWEAFLLQFIQNMNCGTEAQNNPKELIDFLTTRAVFDERDFYQNAYEGGNGKPEIIFLDFRLYGRSGREQFIADTHVLLEKAKHVARLNNLAWAPIPVREIEAIQEWLDRGALECEASDDQALLLLPRLLALALPLTPIILFSSTAKARIRDQLKDYRNIFTGFQKPNPLADPASVENAISSLGNALNRAMPMLRRRLQMAYMQAKWTDLELARPKERLAKHFEIYMDESGGTAYEDENGRQRFYPLFSTAAIFQFESLKDADVKCNKLNEVAKDNNNQYIIKKGTDVTCESLAEEVKKIKSILGDFSKFDIFSIKCRELGNMYGDLNLSRFKDGRLDDAIYQNVVFFTLVYAKYFSEKSTISINIAERRMFERNGAARAQYQLRFGLDNLGNNVKSYNKTSAFPLVRGWLRSWGLAYSERATKIVSLIAKSISGGNPTATFALDWGRSFHYIADWAAGYVGVNGNIQHHQTLNVLRPILGGELFDRFFYSSMMAGNLDTFSECLRLSVASQRPQMGQAIIALCSAPLMKAAGGGELEEIENSEPQEHLWLWAIHPHVTKASGSDLLAGL